MFISKKKYEWVAKQASDLYSRCVELNQAYNSLASMHNELVDRINSDRFIEVTDKELTNLISLCHPDKHGGSVISNEMAAKLLSLKERRKKNK